MDERKIWIYLKSTLPQFSSNVPEPDLQALGLLRRHFYREKCFLKSLHIQCNIQIPKDLNSHPNFTQSLTFIHDNI